MTEEGDRRRRTSFNPRWRHEMGVGPTRVARTGFPNHADPHDAFWGSAKASMHRKEGYQKGGNRAELRMHRKVGCGPGKRG